MQLDAAGAADVLAALDRLEARLGLPRVEAAEQRRLAARAAGIGGGSGDTGWTPHRIDGWYLGLRPHLGTASVGEAGRLTDGPIAVPLTAAAGAGATRVWLRGAVPADVAAAGEAGWHVRRTLLVLGRGLDARLDPPAPEGMRLAPLADVGPAAVAHLLDRAYEGPVLRGLVEQDPDAGPWTTDRFHRVAATALTDPSDLLLAVDAGGQLAGAHWTSRRAHATGEVFNLAVDPDHGGRGVGAWLLGAGMAHLTRLGLRQVVLWVDEMNIPARTLYARAGLTERGRDVALER